MNELKVGNTVYGESESQVFKIVELLGSGGFGSVYKIFEENTETPFAVKAFHNFWSTGSLDERALLNEGKSATKISHRNVVQVVYFHDGSIYDLPPYIIMEYVQDGRTVQAELQDRQPNSLFTNEELCTVYKQLAQGMEAVNKELIHRDIKPNNILVQDGVYKIADFGIAKLVGAATRSNTFKGIGYMVYRAPESFQMVENTWRMDMYSMGMVFYELATLTLPYEIDHSVNHQEAWRYVHLYVAPRDARAINSNLNPKLSRMIMKMLKKQPEERHQAWSEVIEILDRIQNPPPHDQRETDPAIDISGLLMKERVSNREAEQETIQRQLKQQEKKDFEQMVRRRFEEDILQPAKEIVESFNQNSESVELKIRINSSLAFDIANLTRRRENMLETTVEVCPESERVPPTNKPEWAVLDQQRIMAWGTIQYSNSYGINIVLVSAGPDDSLGTWRTVIKTRDNKWDSNSPSIPYERYERSKVFGRAVFGDWSHGWKFTSECLVSLIKNIIR